MPQANENLGVLVRLPSPTDYIAGAVTGIEYKPVNQSGDWSAALPSNESQVGIAGDTYACVTFSALNCLETLFAYQFGPMNFSDRFTAKMSGTTIYGNYLQRVADSIRNDGVILESQWGWDPRQRDPMFDWELFYLEIPFDLKSLGKMFVKEYDVKYEWVDPSVESLKYHLKQAPLQIVTKVCPFWNDSNVKGCGIGSQHATMLYNIDSEGYHIMDHYDPYKKVLQPDYGIAYAMKYTISKRNNKPMLQKGKGKLVRNAATGAYGLNLGDQILDASTERTGLLALDVLSRAGYAVTITQEEWNSIPHKPF